jgi:hypothetical protein
MAMKINELMIGDWVYNKHHKKNIQIQPYDFFVHGHGNNGTFAVSSTIVSGRDLVPIELTEDILVKNGFEKSTRVGTYELNTDYYEIEVWDYSDGLWVVKVQYIEFSSLPYSQATITHVHALQHLLRLCGVEKELVID